MARDIWWDIESRFDDLRRSLRDFEPHRGLEMGRRLPAVDVMDQGNEFVITADVPGMEKKDIDVEVDTRSVTIHAETSSDVDESELGYVRRERSTRSYERRLPLPEEVKATEVKARYHNGVLTITLPKREPSESQTHRITPE